MIPLSPQRFLANNRNLLRDALLTASSVLAVENKVLSIPTARKGTAQVALTGTYTGDEEATYDIQIVDTDVDVPRISAPTFAGAGSGTLSDIEASGSAQIYTVELSNAGTPASVAQIDLAGVKVKARATGVDGNLIRLTVDQTELTFDASAYSLLVDLQAGQGGPTAPFIGQGFDWDSAILDANGLIPTSAHRIAFGDDRSSIYLAYKQFKAATGNWEYHLVPALARNVSRGTPIFFVTGGRDVAVTDGTSTETYTGIVTDYDILIALRTLSTLVVVEGVVANDRSPTGQASRELTLRTDAHAEVSSGSGSQYATGFINTTVTSDAPTELITATCYAVTLRDHPLASLGRERWALKGSLSGDLGTIVTGEAYQQPGGHFGLTVPIKLPPGFGAAKGNFSVVSIDRVNRTPGNENDPPICPVLAPLGPAAVDQTITLTYEPRPTGNCGCDAIPAPNFSSFCLGTKTGDGDGTMTYSTDTIARLVDLRDWYAGIVVANSSQGTGGGDYDQAPLLSKPITRRALGAVVDNRVTQYDETGTTTLTYPNDGNAAASSDVISGRSVYNDSGNTQIDGFPTYDVRRLLSYTPFDTEPLRDMVDRFERALAEIDALEAGALKTAGEDAWDVAVVEMKTDIEDQLDPAAVTYSIFDNVVADPEAALNVNASEAITAGSLVLVYREPGTTDGLLVRKWVPGVAGAKGFVKADAAGSPLTVDVYFAGVNGAAVAEAAIVPGSQYGGSTTTSGRYVVGPAPGNPPTTVYKVGPAVSTTEITHDVINSGLTASGGGATNRLSILADRYRSRLEWVSISGGISHLGKSNASTVLESGDGCWRDTNDAMWFKVVGSEGGEYAPAFVNTPYYSSRRAGLRGRFYSTHEFGFQISVKCPNRLQAGDKIILQINESSWGATYQIGDVLSLPIVSGAALFLTGGVDGSPEQTWNVRGSDDGPLADFIYDPDAPAPYSASGLALTLNPGGIPFAKGDRFRFAVEGGSYQWRKNGGAWQGGSPLPPIPLTATLIDAGLSAEFLTGATTSFVAGDTFRFRALQPWAVSKMQSPTPVARAWKWSGAGATLEAEFDDVEQLDMVALLLTLPDGATVTLEGGVDSSGYTWSETLTYRSGQAWKVIDHTARFVRLTFTDAGSLRFAWIGSPIATPRTADWSPVKTYAGNQQSSGLLQGSRYLGRAVSGDVSWSEGSMFESDVVALSDMLDYVKERDDEPIIFVPQITRTTEPFVFGIINSGSVEFPDIHGYQRNANAPRELSAKIPIAGIWLH